MTVAELIPERQRARLTCTCKVADEIVLDGEALVKVPSAAKSKRPLPKLWGERARYCVFDEAYSAASVLALPLASRRLSTGARNWPV